MSKHHTCPACEALAARYANDPALLAFYRNRLLVRGWAGSTDAVEKTYIMAHADWAQAVANNVRGHGFGGKRTNETAPERISDPQHGEPAEALEKAS